MTQEVSPRIRVTRFLHYSIVRAAGQDAFTFLQGQFGNDLAQVDPQRHQLSCYSNSKGRLLAIFRVFTRDNHYYLRMPNDIAATTIARLKMYVLMAKVELNDVSTSQWGLGVSGTGAAAAITAELGDAPKTINAAFTSSDVSVLRVSGDEDRFEIYASGERIQALQARLAQSGITAGEDEWMLGDILAGIPTVFDATREQFVAQMTNLQLVDGLSFKKGCYPGQEIVARMHYLGKLKRRMYLAMIDADEVPPPGTEVVGADNGTVIGQVVDARAAPGQRPHALVVLNIAAAQKGELRLATAQKSAISLQPLPYLFDVEAKQVRL